MLLLYSRALRRQVLDDGEIDEEDFLMNCAFLLNKIYYRQNMCVAPTGVL